MTTKTNGWMGETHQRLIAAVVAGKGRRVTVRREDLKWLLEAYRDAN